MIWVWLSLSCLLAWLPHAPGQYRPDVYHTLSRKWFTHAMKQPDAYFGYSITYVPTSKRLIVSAPQADNIGEIYSCEIGPQTCTSLPNNITRNYPQYGHNYWLGAVVKAGNSFFVSCAPLAVDLQLSGVNHEIGTFSRCYNYSNPTELPVKLKSLSYNEKKLSYSRNGVSWKTIFEHTTDSFGWSIDVADDNVIIGGPAMFTGRAIKYSGMDQSILGLAGVNIKNGQYIQRADYNFGYSVVAGYFRAAGNVHLTYAIGSPYGKSGYGKILFYQAAAGEMRYNGELASTNLESDTIIKRVPVGSMFGAVLCAARLTLANPAPPGKTQGRRPTGPNPSALVVGAPAFATDDHYNQGAVYIYLPGSHVPRHLKRRIVGRFDGSFFGSAIVSLGDLNGDGLDEIAIGAPYEDSGAGAVYIYSSYDIVSDKPEIKWMQRIVAKPEEHQRTFGLSLTALQDYDDNGCNELAIGAPETNQVMLVNCIATVTIKLYEQIQTFKDNVNRNDTHFQFQSCLEVTYREKPYVIKAHIKVQLQINHPDAKLVNLADKEYSVLLENKEKTHICRSIVVETPEHGNYGVPIKYIITAEQLDNPKYLEKLKPYHVALSDLSKLVSSGSIYLAECSNPNNCMPDLKYISTRIYEIEPYVIGSTTTMNVDVLFRNDGEVAYNPCLIVVVDGATVSATPPECVRASSKKLNCAPKGIVKSNSTWNTNTISLDTTSLTNEFGNIILHGYLYNECTDSKKKTFEKNIELKADPKELFIKGITDSWPEDTVNMTKTDMALGMTFEQSYTISNIGQFDWTGLTATIVVQKRYFIENATVTLSTAGSTSGPQECVYESEDEYIATFNCALNKLEKSKGQSKLTVPMLILPELMESVIEKNENSVQSYLTIRYKSEVLKESQVTSTFHLKDATVPLWVILAAALIGLIILFIFFFLLRECGFFRRQKKENLERVQRHVKRQTVMRKSLLEGARLPPGADQQALIAAEASRAVKTSDSRLRVPSS